LEQDHRGLKQRYWPMCGLKMVITAERFCRLFDEFRAFLRLQSQRNQSLSLARRRDIHQRRLTYVLEMLTTA
jgi:hypothetical protein